jgi:hypothetical protein
MEKGGDRNRETASELADYFAPSLAFISVNSAFDAIEGSLRFNAIDQ